MKNITIQQAFEAHRAGTTVIISSEKKPRLTKEVKKLYNQPIPKEADFQHYVWHYQFFANARPIFLMEE